MPTNSVNIAYPQTFIEPTFGTDQLSALQPLTSLNFLERIVAFVALIVLMPVLAICSFFIAISSTGPIIFRQTRVGQHGRLFSVLKFRSMVTNAESRTGATLSWENDPRITPIGSVLRKLHLDELPQLWNVVRGDMTIIGPRPERPEFVDKYIQQIPRYDHRHIIKPGITGLAQVSASYHARAEEKLVYDLHFVKNSRSMTLNFKIFWLTIAKILHIKGPYFDIASLLPPSRQLESI